MCGEMLEVKDDVALHFRCSPRTLSHFINSLGPGRRLCRDCFVRGGGMLEVKDGSNVIPRRARPGLAGLRPRNAGGEGRRCGPGRPGTTAACSRAAPAAQGVIINILFITLTCNFQPGMV